MRVSLSLIIIACTPQLGHRSGRAGMRAAGDRVPGRAARELGGGQGARQGDDPHGDRYVVVVIIIIVIIIVVVVVVVVMVILVMLVIIALSRSIVAGAIAQDSSPYPPPLPLCRLQGPPSLRMAERHHHLESPSR
jgi:hypothetical protein